MEKRYRASMHSEKEAAGLLCDRSLGIWRPGLYSTVKDIYLSDDVYIRVELSGGH